MSRLILIFLSLCCCGFYIETPESIREHEKEVRLWQKQVKKHHDLKALHRFLLEQIKAHPTVDGVDLHKAKVGQKWKPADTAFVNGDWVLLMVSPEANGFTIHWTYETIPHKEGGGGLWKSVNFQCRRLSKTSYELISASRSEDEYIELNP